jgi:hypothetical protein
VRHRIIVQEEWAQRGVTIGYVSTPPGGDYNAYKAALADALEKAAETLRRDLGTAEADA